MADEITLGTFIENALIEITKGVQGANRQLAQGIGEDSETYAEFPFVIHPHKDANKPNAISFDIAVTASSSEGSSAKISIASIIGIGGDIQSEDSDTQVHRLRFDVGGRGPLR